MGTPNIEQACPPHGIRGAGGEFRGKIALLPQRSFLLFLPAGPKVRKTPLEQAGDIPIYSSLCSFIRSAIFPFMKRSPGDRLHYILLNKPYGVLSQFSRAGGQPTLASLGPFPRDVYAAGRLDADSEGLLLLTNDNSLKHFITEPRFAHPRTYLVQVEGVPDEMALTALRVGVVIGGKGTRPAEARLLNGEPPIPPRPAPVRYRASIPTSWIELTLREGRNRQVRKMTAAVGHPTLRLVRIRIGGLSMEGLGPGDWRRLTAAEIEGLGRK